MIVAALRSPSGASAALLQHLNDGDFTLLLSVPLALEYEAVCHLAEHRLASGLSAKEIDVFVNTLIVLAEPIEAHYRWRPQLRDAGDEMVLETAINGSADALVTFNERNYRDAHVMFGIEVLLPREALRRIRK